MFTRLGHLVVRRRRTVLVATLLGLVAAIVLGSGVFAGLTNGGFDDPDSESTRAIDTLDEEFDTGSADLVVIVTATSGNVDAPEVVAAGSALTEEFAAIDGVDDVASYWSLGSAPPLRSTDGDRALILMRFPGAEEDPERVETIEFVLDEYAGIERDGVTVGLAGSEAVFAAIGETIEGDLVRAESIAVPLTLLLLLFVFGGVVAAGLPVLVGGVSVFGAFMVLWTVTQFTDVSIFSINLVTALGLGLAIDYSLFIVSRFREERAAGRSVDDAVIRTVETAGRTVAFSAITVAISLSALLIFPLYFLRSFAYGGIGVLLVAMVISVVSLPALLAVLGPRVDSLRLFRRRDATGRTAVGTPVGAPVDEGIWHRVATGVMRRPVGVAVTGIVFLLALGVPFLGVEWGVPDDRVLPESTEVRRQSDILRNEFDSSEGDAFAIVTTGGVEPTSIEAYAAEVSTVSGVARVDSAVGRFVDGVNVATDPTLARFDPGRSASGDATWFNVVPSAEPVSADAERMVREIRDLDAPFAETLVGGTSAGLVDSKSAIFDRVPYAAAMIVVATFVLLFMMFGSLLVPLKAIVLNALSLTATFGLMVWVFQEGNGADLLGFTATGLTDISMPILMFCVAFGLSMDYEVFLLSRIKEEYDRTGDNDLAVAVGLEKTGRLVTAAALLLSITFFAFATSGVTFIKLFGLGLAVAVLVDAFIVRSTLVPALMKLAGDRNWWAPGPLRRLHDRFGISEAPPEELASEMSNQGAPHDAPVR
jgi:RND superfamily putative drug exporter